MISVRVSRVAVTLTSARSRVTDGRALMSSQRPSAWYAVPAFGFFALFAVVAGLIASGQIDAGIGCGVEVMSRVFLGQANAPGTGNPYPDDWTIDMGDQFIALSEGRSQAPDAERHFGLVVDDTIHAEPGYPEQDLEALAEAGWQITWSDEPPPKPGQKVSKKKEAPALQVLGFTLDELKDARLAPIVDFKGRKRAGVQEQGK